MIERFARGLKDPSRRARLLWFLWLVSTGVMLLGFVIIFYRALITR